MAIRALHEGKASEAQQVLAFNWIVLECARVGDMSYRAGGQDGARATDFAEGKRFVGNQILKLASDGALNAFHQNQNRSKAKPRGTRK